MAAALEAVCAARDAALVTIAAHAEAAQVKEKVCLTFSSGHMLEYHEFLKPRRFPFCRRRSESVTMNRTRMIAV
ncbi:hypothetical protein L208DRAFT_1408439 [Tricholoma matsutake]|nr:hypothetical protein L208DRAFT_1408439 [Tricholoma matsutake 945]